MNLFSKIDYLHFQAKHNQWLRYFTVFNRIALAMGFLPSGFVKIMGERFTSLAINHPMGHYLEALSYTGYYYTFIGIAQVTAAVLLLIPRTATLGALLYFPIILNICILSFAVCFDGSMLTAPLMVISNLYLLCWDYDKLKMIVSANRSNATGNVTPVNKQFPIVFFTGVGITVVIVALVVFNSYDIRPRNTFAECAGQTTGISDPAAQNNFCNCIHNDGRTYDDCLEEYRSKIDK